jgi:hypothetical protein
LGTRRSQKGELKWLETLKGYKVEPETPEPEFDMMPSRSMLIMARLGECNDCLLSALCIVSTLQLFNPNAPYHLGERSRPVVMVSLHIPGLSLLRAG